MHMKAIVYHGTNRFKEFSDPIVHKRTRATQGNEKITIFNEKSFHCSPLRWIALAYTYKPKTFSLEGKEIFYNIGVDLYNDIHEIEIYGTGSLEESLSALYGKGGYLLEFSGQHFFHTQGLGTLEVITKEIIQPDTIAFIPDPVGELKKENISFKFVDLRNPENKNYRNYNE